MHKKEFWNLTNKCGNYLNTKTRHGSSASFLCLRLFPHLLVKIPNSFLCMCWRRTCCFSDYSPWETNLKSIPFKVVVENRVSRDVITGKVYWSLSYSRHRVVLANKTVCELLKQTSNGYYSNQIPKNFFLFINTDTMSWSLSHRRS